MDNLAQAFQVAAGSVIGKDHVHASKNNHDAYHTLQRQDLIVAVACDGCGSGLHSEVGAKIGARLIVEAISQQYKHLQERYKKVDFSKESLRTTFLEKVRLDILSQLRVLINSMGDSFTQTVNEYFLFTVVGTIIDKDATILFSLGDGLMLVNTQVTQLGPFPGNKPPYLAYGLVSTDEDVPDIRFSINHVLDTDTVESLILGTDGVCDTSNLETTLLPGKDEVFGSILQFVENDKYFKNPDMIRRRLAIANKHGQKVNWEEKKMESFSGILADDTTIVVVRRTPLQKNDQDENSQLQKDQTSLTTKKEGRFPWTRT